MMGDRRNPSITGPLMPSTMPVNPLVTRPTPTLPAQASDRAREALADVAARRAMRPMTPGAQIMPGGRAYAKGGMVGCDWKAPSAKTMRGAARSKGK